MTQKWTAGGHAALGIALALVVSAGGCGLQLATSPDEGQQGATGGEGLSDTGQPFVDEATAQMEAVREAIAAAQELGKRAADTSDSFLGVPSDIKAKHLKIKALQTALETCWTRPLSEPECNTPALEKARKVSRRAPDSAKTFVQTKIDQIETLRDLLLVEAPSVIDTLRDKGEALVPTLAQARHDLEAEKAKEGVDPAAISPTLATLWKIARGFRLPLTCLIAGEATPTAGDTPVFSKEIAVTPVFAFDPWLAQETFEVTMQPGQTHLSEPHMNGTWEDVVLLSGALEMQLDGAWQAVAHRRGLRFRGDRPHGYRAGPKGCTFLSTMHYPAQNPSGDRSPNNND